MQYSQEHLKTMVYAEFRGQTECIIGEFENREYYVNTHSFFCEYLNLWIRRSKIVYVNSEQINRSLKSTEKSWYWQKTLL